MRSYLRIAFCGASGTGKSTLARSVSDALALPLCNVGSREVSAAMGFSSPYDVDRAGKRREFQLELLTQKTKWELSHSRIGFVTDRTHADNLAYTAIHSPEIVPDMLEDARMASERYTHVFLCPLSAFCDTGNDNQRRHDRDYHQQFERCLLELLTETMPPTTRIVMLHQRAIADRVRAILTETR